jgi:hypothetical protein
MIKNKKLEIFEFDQLFNIIFLNFNKKCLMGREKTRFLYQQLMAVEKKCKTAEIGVFEGFSSKIIALCNGNNSHYCYDTFCGVTKSDSNIDKHVDGDFNCPIEKVQRNISLNNVIYKKGIFPETFDEGNLEFSFVHSDTDTYFGTKSSLDCFSKIMCEKGKILFDDYKWKYCPGVEKAISEFLSLNKNYSSLVNGNQCVLTRIS